MTIIPLASLDAEPAWLAEIIRTAKKPRTVKTTHPVIDLDLPDAIARATDYLVHHAPEAVEGAGGDETTYKVAARLRDFGLSQSTAFDLLSMHWNEAGKAIPPWPPEDLRQKVDNAFQYATGTWGGLSGIAEFDAVEILEPEKKRGRLYRVPYAEAAARFAEQPAHPLIKGLLDQSAMAVIYGASNSGKTFLVLDFAFHIATGRPWQGRKTSPGLVVYVAAEGGRGIYKRIAALRQRFGVDKAPLDIIPCPINLRDSRADIADLIALIHEAESNHGQPARMVVIDTLSRALAGGDENASTDMGAFVKNADKIREAVNATLCIVHHSGKDQARGARGWSGLRAATDTEIEVVENTIKVSKQRDLEPMRDLRFRLVSVDLGKDEDGDRISSCVIEITTANEFLKIDPDPAAQKMLDAFEVAQQEGWEAGGRKGERDAQIVTTEQWDDVYEASFEGGTDRIPLPRQRSRLRTRLVEMGHVRKIDKGRWAAG